MISRNMTAAVFQLVAVLLVFAILSSGGRCQRTDFQCQTLAFELFAFARPSENLGCKQACDKQYADLRKMSRESFEGFNLLSNSEVRLKARADAQGIFWIDQCVTWLRYCFRQRAAMLTIDKHAPVLQHSAGIGSALTCLCRSVFLLMQVRKDEQDSQRFCEQHKICIRLTERTNIEYYGFWSCKNSKYIMDASCSMPVPLCPCCQKIKTRHPPARCPNWPEVDELMNEPFVLGDQEWEAYDLHGSPQPEEGFPRGTVLTPQRLACPLEQEGTLRFKAASLSFRTFGTSAYAQAGSLAAESSSPGASRMHSHFEAMSEARERTHQSQECLGPSQRRGIKRKAAGIVKASYALDALASVGQQQFGETSHGSHFPEVHPFPFTTMDDDEAFFGSQVVYPEATSGEGSGTNGIDPDNLQFSQVFAAASDITAEHATMALDPDNLRFEDYYSAVGSAATIESITPMSQSNSDNLVKDNQDSLNAFEGIP